MEKIVSIKGIVDAAKQRGPVPTAVIMPHDANTILAIKDSIAEGLISPLLFGDEAYILRLLKEQNVPLDGIIIKDSKDPIQDAINSVRANQTRLLMKGSVSTPKILKAVLDKTTGLNTGKVCSHLVACQIPNMDRLLIITDGGLNVLPTLEQKVDIIQNAISLAHALGIDLPKVALLASMEEVKVGIPATVDAAILTQMANRGQIRGGIVDGPLALDNIVSKKAAEKKGINSPVAGEADIIVVPSIEVGNALGKSLTYFAGAINAGVVLGAAVPIILPSRAGSEDAKLASVGIGVLLA